MDLQQLRVAIDPATIQPKQQPSGVFFSLIDEAPLWPSSLQKQARRPLNLGEADSLARALPETGATLLIRSGEGYVVEREIPGASEQELAKYLSIAHQFGVELHIDPEMRDDDNVLLLEFAR